MPDEIADQQPEVDGEQTDRPEPFSYQLIVIIPPLLACSAIAACAYWFDEIAAWMLAGSSR